jgi:signal transduction histidine kinase
MRVRPSTLRGSIMLAAFGLVGVVLIVAFGAIDVLLTRHIARSLTLTAAEQLRYLEAAVSHHQHGGTDYLVAELAELEQQTGAIAQVRNQGTVVFASPRLAGAGLTARVGLATHTDGARYFIARSSLKAFDLAVAVPAAPLEQIRGQLRSIMLICLAVGLFASGLAARWLAARAVSPLDRLTHAAERIDARSLGERIQFDGASKLEVDRLAGSFNRMLARLEAAVNGLRRFTADASHELRTPLAILKTQLEADPSPGTASQLEEVNRLQALLDDLLLVSRLDAAAADRERIDFSDLVIETAEQMRALSDVKGVSLTVVVKEACHLEGDRRQLRRLLVNLLDNAVKYTTAGGSVSVAVGRDEQRVRLEIADTGVGIEREHLPHIFEPFFRADSSRSRETGGAGLGLAISARIAENHRASILIDSAPDRGTIVSVLLPFESYQAPICAG